LHVCADNLADPFAIILIALRLRLRGEILHRAIGRSSGQPYRKSDRRNNRGTVRAGCRSLGLFTMLAQSTDDIE